MDSSFPQRDEKKINSLMKCIKYMLIIINVSYLILSCLMISGATTLKVLFDVLFFVLWHPQAVDSLSNLWLLTGCFLLALSIFGIVAAVKESTMLTNIYGIFLLLIFILQMATAVTSFTLITQTSEIVGTFLNDLITYFYYNEYEYRDFIQDSMNWVQTTFQCCGNDDPSDWYQIGQHFTTQWEPPYGYTGTTPGTTEPASQLPQSCCDHFDYDENVCRTYFTKGCHGPMHSVVIEAIRMIGSSALVIGVAQIFGVICAFTLARIIRRNKTLRVIDRLTMRQGMGFDQRNDKLAPLRWDRTRLTMTFVSYEPDGRKPSAVVPTYHFSGFDRRAYVHQLTTPEPQQREVKHI